MRIGLVCPYDLSLPGGVQQIVMELGRQLQDRGHEAVVVGPGEPAEDPGVRITSVGASVVVSANKSRVPIAVRPSAWNLVTRSIDQVSVVHVHEPFIPLVGWAALAMRSTATVATFHADPPRWARGLYAVLASLGDMALGGVTTTAVSQVAARAVPRVWPTPRLVPNAIDVASYRLDVERRPQRVAFLGRDDPRKGLSVLLEAWPVIKERHPDAELEVMGAGRPVTSSGVTFHGTADEATKRELLASTQVFVAPNLGGESFGVVVAEGMAAGCAVVASDIAAFRDVLGDDGVMVPRGDSHALADAVSVLLGDADKARGLGKRARVAVERFDWSVVVEAYEETYRNAVHSRGGTIHG